MKAIAYVRVSTLEQATEGVSLDAQEARTRAYCQMTGLELAEVIRDEGVSAGKPLATRPGGAELLQRMCSGEVRHVVALKLDRLFRDAADCLVQTRAWDKNGVTLHLVDMGGLAINTTNAMGRMFLTLTAAFAELERNLIAERTSLALQHKIARGEHVGAPALGTVIVNGEARDSREEITIVERILDLRGRQMTLREIAAALESEGHQTKRGGRWAAETIRKVLRRAGVA
ncbi:MAG: recombinase family protein [Armatimonadetes bacterium]|nr:recombinase family protein [Armatimonadota bacterium]